LTGEIALTQPFAQLSAPLAYRQCKHKLESPILTGALDFHAVHDGLQVNGLTRFMWWPPKMMCSSLGLLYRLVCGCTEPVSCLGTYPLRI